MYGKRWVAALLVVAVGLGCDEDPTGIVGGGRLYSSTETASWDVSGPSTTIVETFTGALTVRQGEAGVIDVVTTRQADREEDLVSLPVEAVFADDVLELTATNPSDLRNVQVDFDLTGPVDMDLDARVAVGSVDCRGRPPERWEIDVGVGSVDLVVPADVNVRVELVSGVGSVEVGFAVQGTVERGRVIGTIGDGTGGEIIARCGVGSVTLTAQ